MKFALWIVGIILGLAATFGIVQTLAAERVEVVELHTVDEAGESVTTRLWVVDYEGSQYLRGDARPAGWPKRLRDNGTFDVTRNGERNTYSVVLREDQKDVINRLFKEKYTWGDDFFETVLGGRDESVPFQLIPNKP